VYIIMPEQYLAVFESRNGYNVSVRLGRIYTFSCRGVAAYMCVVNPDLIDVSYWLRHFVRHFVTRIRLNIAARKITPHDIYEISIGKVSIRKAIMRHLPTKHPGPIM